MPAQLVENIQYFGSDGLPLVGGLIYIGTVGLEPIGNLITNYSDEALTTTIANPQTIGADGFSANKIYIPAKYSIRVNTVLGAQFLLDQNAGASVGTGTTSLTSVLGTNAITAQGEASVVTTLVDKEVYTLKIANTNDGISGVTLKIDATPIKSIVKNFNQPIDPGDFTQNQIIRVAFNSTADNYAWVDASVKTKRLTKGADLASATSITVPDNDGNYRDITGTATIATINGVAETFNTFQMDAAASFTNSASLIMIGGNFTAAAGDVLEFYQLTASTAINTKIAKADGTAVVSPTVAIQSVMETATNNTDQVTPLSTNWHPGVAKVWVNFNGTGTIAIRGSHNVTSLTDNGTGRYSVNFTTDFSTVNYAVVGGARRSNLTQNGFFYLEDNITTPIAVGSCRVSVYQDAVGAQDGDFVCVACFGDQ